MQKQDKRKNTMFYRLLALAMLVFVGQAKATGEPGSTIQNLYNWCKTGDATGKLMCVNYVAGVTDTMTLVGADHSETSSSWGMCITGRVSHVQAIQVLINWAEKNPKLWNEGKGIGAVVALRETWPCEVTKK
jgi:Ssp1 endopeptidase immunity protein Rap1a